MVFGKQVNLTSTKLTANHLASTNLSSHSNHMWQLKDVCAWKKKKKNQKTIKRHKIHELCSYLCEKCHYRSDVVAAAVHIESLKWGCIRLARIRTHIGRRNGCDDKATEKAVCVCVTSSHQNVAFILELLTQNLKEMSLTQLLLEETEKCMRHWMFDGKALRYVNFNLPMHAHTNMHRIHLIFFRIASRPFFLSIAHSLVSLPSPIRNVL